MIRIGCSGWQYRDWRGVLYEEGLPQKRWLERYAETFDTVEVNTTFYRLTKPDLVRNWCAAVPEDFIFTVKGSRYLTHMKRLLDREQGLRNFYDSIEPLVATPRLGPVLWQLPPNFRRDDERLADWLAALPAGRHALEFRHDSWFTDAVFDLLRSHEVALVLADDGRKAEYPYEQTADWSFVRFHWGRRGRRGNYSDAELRDWGDRVRDLSAAGDVFVYFNNDWEGFAVRNAQRLRSEVAG